MTITARAHRAGRIAAVLASVVLGAGVLLAGPAAAQAATGAAPTQVVQFSTDGIHWSDRYTAALFAGVVLVPNGSASRAFYVRNGAVEPAILTLTLADVTTDDPAFANGVTLSSSTAGAPGAAIAITSAQPCATLSDGLRLSSGDSVRVDNTTALADLAGTAGQKGHVWFHLRVSLRSADAAAPVPNTCPTTYGSVDTFVDPTEGGGTTTPASLGSTAPSTTVYHRTAQGWTPGTSVGGQPITVPATPTTPEQPSTPLVQTLVSNTARLYQEYDVAFWLAMSVLGAVVVVLARRRRAEDQPEEPEYREQIGTDR